MKYKAVVKINIIPKIKCCFFDTFQANIIEENEELMVESLRTKKSMKANKIKINNALFGSGKILVGLLILILGIHNYMAILPIKALFLLLGFWFFAVLISVYFSKDEDIVLFFTLIITSFYLAVINKFTIMTIDYFATNTLFFMGNVFMVKGVKEALYDIQITAKSVDNNFILKIKKIEEEQK